MSYSKNQENLIISPEGSLTLPGDPVNANDPANKDYVDAKLATKLNLTGGTLTGALTLSTGDITLSNGDIVIRSSSPAIDFQIAGNTSVNSYIVQDANGVLSVYADSDIRLGVSGANGTSSLVKVDQGVKTVFFGTGSAVTSTANIYDGNSDTVAGVALSHGGIDAGSYNEVTMNINRMGSDGTIIKLLGQGTAEGEISVSGSVVSYGTFTGKHWSQLEDNSKQEILLGTIMESIDAMCEWPNETNKHLPKCKISDTPGSKNVYGTFMSWDEDWKSTNDLNIASIGTFVCRMAPNQNPKKVIY